jgi:hypothetical protein
MRFYSLVAAAALLTASLAAHADTITQTFAVPLSAPGSGFNEASPTINPFNPA